MLGDEAGALYEDRPKEFKQAVPLDEPPPKPPRRCCREYQTAFWACLAGW